MPMQDRTFVTSSGDLTVSQTARNFKARLSDDYHDASFIGTPTDAKLLLEWLTQYLEAVGEHLPECERDVYKHGTVVGIIAAPSAVVEAVVREAASQSGQRMDWHYVGGRGVVKTLGDPKAAYDALVTAYGQSNLEAGR